MHSDVDLAARLTVAAGDVQDMACVYTIIYAVLFGGDVNLV